MPPDGYQTVTLPSELAQRLDQMNAGSRAGAIRALLAAADEDDVIDYAEVERRCERAVENVMEGRLR